MIGRGSRTLAILSTVALALSAAAFPFGHESPLAALSNQLLLNPSTPREYNLPTLTNNLAIKFDEDGSMIDAHDGKLYWAEDKQRYVLVGAAYDCGFIWLSRTRSWCGVRIYSSLDLIRWKNHGLVMNYQEGKPEHGFRPKLAFNARTKLWVLFWNVHNDNYPERGLEIWTSRSVFGGYEFASRPVTLGTPNDFSIGVNSRTGAAYLIYGLNLVGDLTIEELSPDYLQMSGKYTQLPYPAVEGFDMQWHEPTARFYLIFGRLCAYCNGTDTNVIHSTDALDRDSWSPPEQISWDSCGGQSSFLTSLPNIYGSETLVFGSDLWDNANPNEAKARMYWEPLLIGPHGKLPKLQCLSNHSMDIAPAPGKLPTMTDGPFAANVDQSSGQNDFQWVCNTPNLGEYQAGQHLQSWTVGKDGVLSEVGFAASRLHSDGQLNAEVFKFNDYGEVFDSANWIMPPIYDPLRITLVGRRVLFPEEMDWGVKNWKIPLDTPVKKGDRFLLLLGTHGATNQYCFAVRNTTESWKDESSPRMHAYRRGTAGGTRDCYFRWVPDELELKFYSIVT